LKQGLKIYLPVMAQMIRYQRHWLHYQS